MALGVATQLPDNLSEYMKIGRSLRPGPVTGVIECFNYSVEDVPTDLGSDLQALTYVGPGFYTIQAVTWNSRAQTGTPDLRIVSSLTATPFVIDNPNEIFASLDMGATPQGITRSAGLVKKTIDGSTNPWLGIWLNMGSATMTDFACTIWFYRHGHVNENSVDD